MPPPVPPSDASEVADDPASSFPEKALPLSRESVHFVRRLLHLAPDVVHVYDLRARQLVYVNQRLTDVLGYGPADLPTDREGLLALLVEPKPADLGAFVTNMYTAATNGETIEYECTVRHKNGSPRVLRTRGSVLRRDADGRPLELLGISEDVTAERQAQADLRRREAQLAESQRLFQYGSWEWEVGTDLVRWSDELVRIFGYDPTRIAGVMPFNFYFDHIPGEERGQFEALTSQIIAGHLPLIGFEHTIVTPTGQRKRLRVRGTVVRDPDERVTAFRGTCADITAEHEAAERLRQREALLRETETLFRYGSWEWEVGTGTVRWSEGLFRLLGHDSADWPDGCVPETLYGQHVTGEEARRYQQRVDEALATGGTYETEHWLRTRQGERRRVRVRGSVLPGEPRRLVGTVADVTDEYEATERLREAEAVRSDVERFFGYGSWVWDLTGDARSVVWSAGNARLFGYDPDEIPEGRVTVDFVHRHVHPDDLERFQRLTNEAIRRRDLNLTLEFRAITKQGEGRHFMRRARLMLDDAGHPLRLVGHNADVTDERHLADQLSRSEELNRRINEVSPDFIAIFDVKTGRNRYVGRQLRDALGYSEQEVERHGGNLFFALDPDDWDKLREFQARIPSLADGEFLTYQVCMSAKDGRRLCLRTRATVFSRDEAGLPAELMSVTQDVTELEEKAETLRRSEAFNRRLVELSPDFITVYNLQTRQNLAVGQPLYEYLGYTRAEYEAGGGNYQFILENDEEREKGRHNIEAALALPDGAYLTSQVRLRAKNGCTVIMRGRTTVLRRAAGGGALELMTVSQDVTEAEAQAGQLRESEAFNRRLLELSPDAIGLYDLRTRRSRYVSAAALPQWFGYTPDEVEALGGNLLGQFWNENAKAEFETGFARALNTMADNEVATFTMNMRRKDGSPLVLFVRVTIIRRDADGQPLEVMSIYQDVTERELLLDQLRRRDQLLDHAQSLLRFGGWEWEPGRPPVWTPGLYRLFGHDPDALPPDHVTDDLYDAGIHPDDQAVIRQRFGELFDGTRNEVSFEFRFRTPAGAERVMAGKATKLTADGPLLRLVGATVDVTEERQLSQNLRRSEALLSQAERAIGYGNFEVDLATRRVVWSAGMARLLGYDIEGSTQSLALETALGFIPPDDLPRAAAAIERVLNHPEPVEFKHRIRRPDGQTRVLSGQAVPQTDARSRVVGLVGSVRDVTEQEAAAERLEKQEYLLREAETLLNFGSWEWNITTGDILWSEGLYGVFGYGPDDRPARITFEVYQRHLHPDEVERALQRNAEVMREKGTFEGEYRILTTHGQERWVHEKGIVVTDDAGNIVRLMGSTADVTELKQYQAELERRVADLARSNADLERFAYVASHDLQEPLRKITSFGERLTRRHADGLGTDGRLYLERMMGAATRMRELIDNLLNFSRVARQVDDFAPTDLNAVLRGVLGDLELKITEKGAAVDVGDLPTLDALPGQMPQLFQNLLGNALKFSRPDVPPRVRVRAEAVGAAEKAHYRLNLRKKWVKLCVEDNGIGFDPQYAEKIFVLFQRLHGRSEYEGTGIGLATVKKIVENHRGLVYAESTPGQGARFVVLLPLAQPAE